MLPEDGLSLKLEFTKYIQLTSYILVVVSCNYIIFYFKFDRNKSISTNYY